MAGGKLRISFAGWTVSNKFVSVSDGDVVIYRTDAMGELVEAANGTALVAGSASGDGRQLRLQLP